MGKAKIGLIAGLVGSIGIPLGLGIGYVRNYVRSYCDALSSYRTAKLMPYDVPPDGSVSIGDFAKGEGLSTSAERSAFSTIASRNMFGKGTFTQVDSLGNVTVLTQRYASDLGRKYTCPVEIPESEWSGGLPKGHQVWLPDVNGDGKVSPFADYRNRSNSSIMAETRSNVKDLRNQGLLR